jgi:hypothetical protein
MVRRMTEDEDAQFNLGRPEDFSAFIERDNDEEAHFIGVAADDSDASHESISRTELKKMVEKYTDELKKALSARERWLSNKLEYETVVKDLAMKVEEAQDRIQSLQSLNRLGNTRGAVIIGNNVGRNHITPGYQQISTEYLLTAGDDDLNEINDGLNQTADDLEFEGFNKLLKKLRMFGDSCIKVLRYFDLFSGDVKRVQAKYGGPLIPYLSFLQSTITLGLITLVIHAPIIITQGVTNSTSSHICGLLDGACWTLYGGLGSNLEKFYIIIALGSSLATCMYAVYMWSSFDRQYQLVLLRKEFEGQKRFSKVALCAWDFRISDEKEKENKSGQMVRFFEALKVDDETDLHMKSLTKEQKRKIFLTRIGCFFLVLLVLLAGWTAIGSSTYFQKSINSFFAYLSNDNTTVAKIVQFIPSAIVSILGFLTPRALNRITEFEYWSPAMKEKQLTWRLYLGNILNVLIYVFLYYSLVAKTSDSLKLSSAIVSFDDTTYSCKEDQAGASLVQLSVTNLVSNTITDFGFMVVMPSFRKYVQKQDSWKAEFSIAPYVVQHTITLSLSWLALVLSPFYALVFPVIMILRYLTIRVILKFADVSSASFTETLSVGVLIMRLFSITSVIYATFSLLIFTLSHPHDGSCGPIASASRGIDVFGTNIHTNFNTISIVFLCIAVLFALLVIFRNNKVSAYRDALDESNSKSSNVVNQLQRELKRANGQLNVLRSRVDRQKQRQQ